MLIDESAVMVTSGIQGDGFVDFDLNIRDDVLLAVIVCLEVLYMI